MNTKNIKILIDAFYEGKTNPEEELLLQKYFNGNEIAQELLIEREIFLQLYEPNPTDVPDLLKSKLTNLIDSLDRKEKKKIRITKTKMIQWTSIAASIAILVSAGLYMNKLSFDEGNQTLSEKSEVATAMYSQISETEYAELKSALLLFSSNFSKGIEQLDEMNNNLEKTSDILNKTFKR